MTWQFSACPARARRLGEPYWHPATYRAGEQWFDGKYIPHRYELADRHDYVFKGTFECDLLHTNKNSASSGCRVDGRTVHWLDTWSTADADFTGHEVAKIDIKDSLPISRPNGDGLPTHRFCLMRG